MAPNRPTIAALVRRISDRHDLWSVWSDFVEMAAIAISNGVDLAQQTAREARYMAIVGRYDAPTANRFAEAFGALVVAFEGGIDDILGRTFMELELGSKWAGQFFTPFAVCRMMAELSLDGAPAIIAERGYVTASDPAVGAGAMQLALVGVPAIVVVGDTLRMEERARWYTPAHVWGGWSRRLARDRNDTRPEPAQPSAQLALF